MKIKLLNRKAMAIYQLVIDEDGEYETTEVQNSTTANKYHDVRKDVIR
jgi:ureidoglycolate hydrolase